MCKVLMVDDNYDNLVILRAILKAVAPECSSRFASSGEEALRIVAVDRPDVIILDILMPGMDGFEVCSRLKEDQGYSDIPVILLTAMDSSPENRTKGLKCGADAFLTKPVSEVELEAQMRALLGKKQQTAILKSDLQGLQKQVDKDRARLQFEGVKHRSIVDNLQDGVLLYDLSSGVPRLVEANSAASRLLSLSKGDIREGSLDLPMEGGEFFLDLEQEDKAGGSTPVEVRNRPFYVEGRPLVLQVVRDITDLRRLEVTLKENADHLAKALNRTIDVLSLAVEARDPYTAGHQRRVADLSKAMAQALLLDEAHVELIYRSALIHDVGKISVPVELLSKPSALSEVEFALIRQHPVTGYDIVNRIDLSREMTLAVRQHHERLDGTGYPDGLKGDQIIPEARILAVADVVEAMSSHRPYRPALGVEAALNEIGKGRGIVYDPDAVDACVHVIKEGLVIL
nr:HD domain-containing phosphohydrolase [uncultured Dethiosulfovibrio sp.]